MNRITDLLIEKLKNICMDNESTPYFDKVSRSLSYSEATEYFRSCSVKSLGTKPYKRGKESTFEIRCMCRETPEGEIELEYASEKLLTQIKLSDADILQGATLAKIRKSGMPYFQDEVWAVNLICNVRWK